MSREMATTVMVSGYWIDDPFSVTSPVFRSSSEIWYNQHAWWRHQIEAFSASLALCARNSPVTVNYPHKGPVTRSFGVFFDLCRNKRLSKQSEGWWFKTPSHPLWRHCNEEATIAISQLINAIDPPPALIRSNWFCINLQKPHLHSKNHITHW